MDTGQSHLVLKGGGGDSGYSGSSSSTAVGTKDRFTVGFEVLPGSESVAVTVYEGMRQFRWRGVLSVQEAKRVFDAVTGRPLSNREIDAVARIYKLEPPMR